MLRRFTWSHDQRVPTRSHEELLLFHAWQSAGGAEAYPDGGSWVIAVSREEVRTFRIPDAAVLESQVRLFQAAVERRDGSEVDGAARLYRDLEYKCLPEG